MTDTELTALSTFAWLIGTVTLFILLAHWSAGGSWGISAAVARGIIGWAGRSGAIAGTWPSDEELGPILPPETARLWGEPGIGATSADAAEPVAEMEDLGARRLP